jgi:hypothetical protein
MPAKKPTPAVAAPASNVVYALMTKNGRLVLTKRTKGKKKISYVWDLLKSNEVDASLLPSQPDRVVPFFDQVIHVYDIDGDHTHPAINGSVAAYEMGLNSLSTMSTRIRDSPDRTVIHARVDMLRRSAELSRRKKHTREVVRMTIEEAGFVPDSPPAAKRQRTAA